MRYVYFTKFLRELDLAGLVGFCKDTGVEGFDLAVRPGYPVHPDNVATELPKAAKLFADAGLVIGLVTLPTGAVDPESKAVRAVFEACGKAGVPAIKIGYFPYTGKIDAALKDARRKLAGFAELAKQTGVRASYHTHSGHNLGSNAGVLRMMLQDLDPHHVGAFLDTGHLALGGAPLRIEVDLVRAWFSLLAIRDMVWEKGKAGWNNAVGPAGGGCVDGKEVAKALAESKFNGTVVLHGEYELKDLATRKDQAKQELAFLKKLFG